MKTVIVGVSWTKYVQVEVDESRLGDELYVESVRSKAVLDASNELDAKNGFVVACEDAIELVE